MDKVQTRVDHVVMRLICVRGLVPNILDSPEWKELIFLLNDHITATSSSTFSHKIIPQEAVYVREKMIALLKEEEDLTLTFDGTGTRRPNKFYTAHTTTSDRRSFMIGAHQGSDIHQTAEWVTTKLHQVSWSLTFIYKTDANGPASGSSESGIA